MSVRLEVETVIRQLPETEVRELAKWLQSYLDEMWDRQIESDLNNGKLDSLIDRAEADITIGKVKELVEYYWIWIGTHDEYESFL